jgi:hypothetical protein
MRGNATDETLNSEVVGGTESIRWKSDGIPAHIVVTREVSRYASVGRVDDTGSC